MAEWPWRCRSRSMVIMHDTPSHASDHLCLISEESFQNCRSYRAEMECGMDEQTDRRMEWNWYVLPPNNFVVQGRGIKNNILCCVGDMISDTITETKQKAQQNCVLILWDVLQVQIRQGTYLPYKQNWTRQGTSRHLDSQWNEDE